MGHLGLGAMIQMLGGNEESYNAYHAALNKKIVDVKLDPELNSGDGALVITFKDDTTLTFYDCARSCCESRYMSTEDDLSQFKNCTFKGIEIIDGGTKDPGDYGEVSETVFLHVKTTKGKIVVNTYNHHNGYYGGILIYCK